MSPMRISQLAERSGVPATTLRFYEGAGLLPAGRSPSGYRLYGEDALDRLAFIGAAKHLGLPLDEVAQLLEVWESGACAEVKAGLRPRLANRLAEAETRATETAHFATTLRRALAHLDSLPDRPDPCDPSCGLLPVTQDDVPVACSLDAADTADRIADWRRLTEGAPRAPLADGLRLTLPIGRLREVADLAAAEQACCPFLDFHLHLDGPNLHLEVRAPAAGAETLASLFT